MRNALLALAGAAVMGTILVGPAHSQVGRTLGVSAVGWVVGVVFGLGSIVIAIGLVLLFGGR